MLFQEPVYKLLYIYRGVTEAHWCHSHVFKALGADKSKAVLKVRVYPKLVKEGGSINNYDEFFVTKYLDNVLL
jgi:hypothetical protein